MRLLEIVLRGGHRSLDGMTLLFRVVDRLPRLREPRLCGACVGGELVAIAGGCLGLRRGCSGRNRLRGVALAHRTRHRITCRSFCGFRSRVCRAGFVLERPRLGGLAIDRRESSVRLAQQALGLDACRLGMLLVRGRGELGRRCLEAVRRLGFRDRGLRLGTCARGLGLRGFDLRTRACRRIGRCSCRTCRGIGF